MKSILKLVLFMMIILLGKLAKENRMILKDSTIQETQLESSFTNYKSEANYKPKSEPVNQPEKDKEALRTILF